MTLAGRNCTRNERIAADPRQSVAAGFCPLMADPTAGLELDNLPLRWHQGRKLSSGPMKMFLLKLFTWWNGQTFGTQLWTWRFGELVGTDEQGNRYFRTKGRKIDPTLGFERRWVVYNGYAEATRVPPSWHGWLHHTVDVAPTEESYEPHEWEKPHVPNMTGTALAYRPSGSTLAGGRRPAATGDYQAWTPGN
jgi:NADH:ubiquinone oxidoreductase subunit